jgi:hypothetical protein
VGILSGGTKETLIQVSSKGLDDDGDNSITKKDLDKVRKQIKQDNSNKQNQESMLEVGRKGFNAVRHGLNDVAKSLNTPHSHNRPKIARIQAKGAEELKMNIGKIGNLKNPSLRGRDIRGKRIKPE